MDTRDRQAQLAVAWPNATTFSRVWKHRSIPSLADYQEAWLIATPYIDNGRTALVVEIVDDIYPETYTSLSVNLPESPNPGEGWFYVKDWSENTGLAAGLAAAGVIELADLPAPIRTGYVEVTQKARVIAA